MNFGAKIQIFKEFSHMVKMTDFDFSTSPKEIVAVRQNDHFHS